MTSYEPYVNELCVTYFHQNDYAAVIRERDEARAELAKVKESAAWHERNAKFFSATLTHMTEERDALRSAVEKHNELCDMEDADGQERSDYRIPLPPSAAPAASEPKGYLEARPLDDEDIFVWGACTHIKRQYPVDVFPEDGESLDCKSAKMARMTCDNIWRYYLEQKDGRAVVQQSTALPEGSK